MPLFDAVGIANVAAAAARMARTTAAAARGATTSDRGEDATTSTAAVPPTAQPATTTSRTPTPDGAAKVGTGVPGTAAAFYAMADAAWRARLISSGGGAAPVQASDNTVAPHSAKVNDVGFDRKQDASGTAYNCVAPITTFVSLARHMYMIPGHPCTAAHAPMHSSACTHAQTTA